MKYDSAPSHVLSILTLLVSGLACLPAFGQGFIVKDGKANAEIVIAEVRPRMATLAALELQYYLEKISGARLPITTKPGEPSVKIYVGKSKYTEGLKVTDKGLKYGAFRMVSGASHLVLLGHDSDFVPPKPWPRARRENPSPPGHRRTVTRNQISYQSSGSALRITNRDVTYCHAWNNKPQCTACRDDGPAP